MNQSNSFKYIIDDFYPYAFGVSPVNKIDPKEYPFVVCSKDFKTRAEAENYAKKRSGEIGDDVIISHRVTTVKFPVPDLKVEELVVS